MGDEPMRAGSYFGSNHGGALWAATFGFPTPIAFYKALLFFPWKGLWEAGAAYVTRTRDPRITNAVLYRLS